MGNILYSKDRNIYLHDLFKVKYMCKLRRKIENGVSRRNVSELF